MAWRHGLHSSIVSACIGLKLWVVRYIHTVVAIFLLFSFMYFEKNAQFYYYYYYYCIL
jgi:hypothetical protein